MDHAHETESKTLCFLSMRHACTQKRPTGKIVRERDLFKGQSLKANSADPDPHITLQLSQITKWKLDFSQEDQKPQERKLCLLYCQSMRLVWGVPISSVHAHWANGKAERQSVGNTIEPWFVFLCRVQYIGQYSISFQVPRLEEASIQTFGFFMFYQIW